MEVRSYKDLEKVLQRAAKKALEDSGKEATKLVKDRIDKDVYGVKATPDDYIRTYELRESVEPSKVETKGNISELEVGHNTDKIHPNSPNQHMSVVDGLSSADYVAKIVHDGESGKIFGEGYWTKPRPYMSNAKDDLENGEYKKMMKNSLEKQGFKVE